MRHVTYTTIGDTFVIRCGDCGAYVKVLTCQEAQEDFNKNGSFLRLDCPNKCPDPFPRIEAPLVKGGQGRDAEGLTVSAWFCYLCAFSLVSIFFGYGVAAFIQWVMP